MPVAGNVIRDLWLYLDGSDVPKTGMVSPTDVSLVLKRDSGAGFVDASETVTWTEKGSGYYEPAFTPINGGFYRLFLQELNADSFQRRWTFPYEVLTAGATFLPAFTNAFCAETDVERWAQLAFDNSSKPTSDQVAAFAQSRASEMRSLLATEGWTIGPTTVTPGSLEQDTLREANAIGAAADAYLAKFIDVDPGQTQKAVALLDEYTRRLERLMTYAREVVGSVSVRTPMSSGELTLATETPITDGGLSLGITMDQEF